MRNLSKKAKTIIAGAAIAGLASTGVAYAYWTTTGHGDSSATTAETAPTLTLTGTPASGLIPGSYVDVPIVAHNGTTASLVASTLTVSDLTSGVTACDELVNHATAAATSPVAAVTVAPSGQEDFGSVRISLPNSATEDQNVCKHVTYTFVVDAS